MKKTNEFKDVSRRTFLKGALIGGAALTLSSRLALAKQMATGRQYSIEEVRGVGVPPGLVRLASNENPLGPSPWAMKAIADNMYNINRYSFSSGGLIEALAKVDGVPLPEAPPPSQTERDFGFRRRPPTPYITTSGSGQLLSVLALTYLSKGGEVVEAELGYGDISGEAEDFAEERGIPARAISVPMGKGYRHDLNAMLSAITPNAKMVVITNPNNPTGTLLSYEDLEAFVNKVPKNVIVVIDEAYIHFVKDLNYKHAIPLALANENVIVTRTFSKVYGMPAMRLGYGVCSQKMKDEMGMYAIGRQSLLTVEAGTAAAQDLEHVRRSQEVVWAFRDRCYAEFDKMGLEYIPSEGTFMMVNLGREAMPVVREMMRRNVWVGLRAREKMPNWIRVSAGTEAETEVFLQTLREVMTAI